MASPDPARARSFAALLARPRLCGTPGEREAAARIREAFRDAELETAEEHFHFRPSGDRAVRLFLLWGLASLAAVAAGAVWERWSAAAGFASLAALAVAGPGLSRRLLLAGARGAREGEVPPPGWVAASNVVARAVGPAAAPLLVFVGHFDSKSQNLSIATRIALFLLLGVAGLAVLALSVLRLAAGVPGDAAIGVFFSAAAAAALALLSLRTGNASPGALDNASGAAAVVELARLWRAHPLSGRARAVFLCPSAEEHGLVGSWLWVRRHAQELRGEGRLRVLNFDGVGARGRWVALPARGPVADALEAAARRLGLRLWRAPLGVGLLADHVPFVQSGFACTSLLSHSPAARRIHTARDGAEALEDEAFREVLELALAAAAAMVEAGGGGEGLPGHGDSGTGGVPRS